MRVWCLGRQAVKRSTWTGSADATKTVRACDQQMEDIVIQADGEYHGAAGLEPWGGGSIGLLVLRIEIDRAGIITPLNKARGRRSFLPLWRRGLRWASLKSLSLEYIL